MGRWLAGRPPGSPRRLRTPSLPVLVTTMLLCLLAAPTGTDGQLNDDHGGRQGCNWSSCWDLFQLANAQLGIRDDYPPPRDQTPSPEGNVIRCVSLRTYYLCIQNMTQSCRGDLSFHSAKQILDQNMKQFNCGTKGRVFIPSDVPAVTPHPAPPVCSYRGNPKRNVCSMFGDPHLRTFGRDFMTCRVSGAWSLLDNDYLTIQVTSEPVHGVLGTPATALSKVTLIVKGHDDCAMEDYITYQAPDQQGTLPASFDDGRTHFGPQKSVQIVEKEHGKHVEIYLRYIDTRLVIRRYGRYMAITVSIPQDLVQDSRTRATDTLQLCLHGCPSNQQLHLQDILTHKHGRLKNGNMSPSYSVNSGSGGATPTPQGQVALPRGSGSRPRTMSREAAQERCKIARVVDAYWDSCVFDLISTGDSNFTRIAYNAMQDALRLLPEEFDHLKNRTTVLAQPAKSSAAPSGGRYCTTSTNLHYLHRTTYILLYTLFSCVGLCLHRASVVL